MPNIGRPRVTSSNHKLVSVLETILLGGSITHYMKEKLRAEGYVQIVSGESLGPGRTRDRIQLTKKSLRLIDELKHQNNSSA